MDTLSQWDYQLSILLNVFIAMILGGVVGLERELARKPAGLRTLMLVAGASAMLVGIADTLRRRYGEGSRIKNSSYLL